MTINNKEFKGKFNDAIIEPMYYKEFKLQYK